MMKKSRDAFVVIALLVAFLWGCSSPSAPGTQSSSVPTSYMSGTLDIGTVDSVGRVLIAQFRDVLGRDVFTTKMLTNSGTMVYDLQSNKLGGSFTVQDANKNPIVTLSGVYRETILYDNTVRYLVAKQGNKYFLAGDPLDTSVHVYTSSAGGGTLVPVTGLSLSKTTDTFAVGASDQLLTTFTPLAPSNMAVTWSSSDPTVATVSAGLVTGKAVGTATITATTVDGGKTAACAVLVTAPVTVFVGKLDNPGTDNGDAATATLLSPGSLVSDGTWLYDADFLAIRKIDPATGSVSTVSVSSYTFDTTVGLAGLAVVGSTLYVSDRNNNRIVSVPAAGGAGTVIAGDSTTSHASGKTDNSTGTSARFMYPQGLATDGTYLYVADSGNYNIRKIALNPPYAVTTLAGTGTSGSADNTTGTLAQFSNIKGLTVSGSTLYVTDGFRIRAVSLTSLNAVTTVAGSGTNATVDGIGTAASFTNTWALVSDGTNLFVGEDNAVRKIVLASGKVSTYATVPGSTARIGGLVIQGGNLYFTETYRYVMGKAVLY